AQPTAATTATTTAQPRLPGNVTTRWCHHVGPPWSYPRWPPRWCRTCSTNPSTNAPLTTVPPVATTKPATAATATPAAGRIRRDHVTPPRVSAATAGTAAAVIPRYFIPPATPASAPAPSQPATRARVVVARSATTAAS